jgi:hypothetical protein
VPRTFTLDEARELLPALRQIVTSIQEQKRLLDSHSAELEGLLESTAGNGHASADKASARKGAEEAAAALERLIGELDDLGVEMKGIEQGLVDFPSIREGRVVYLCWQLGEDDIAWWHELDTGFAGRQPLL